MGRKRILDPFENHLFTRWIDGCRSPKTLWLKLQNRGFSGLLKSVERWARRQRLAAEVAPDKLPVERPGKGFNVRMLSWLLVRKDTELNEEECALVGQLEQSCPAVVTARGLALHFARDLKQQNPNLLNPTNVQWSWVHRSKPKTGFIHGILRALLDITSIGFSLFALTWAQNANSSHAFEPRAARVAIDNRIATEPKVQVFDA